MSEDTQESQDPEDKKKSSFSIVRVFLVLVVLALVVHFLSPLMIGMNVTEEQEREWQGLPGN